MYEHIMYVSINLLSFGHVGYGCYGVVKLPHTCKK